MEERKVNEQELIKLVIGSLRRHANIQTTIVPALIKKTDWDWERCEDFIDQVQRDHRAEIVLWQSNVFVIVGYVFIAVGLVIILIAVEAYIGFERLIDCIRVEISNKAGSFNECMYSGLAAAEALYEFGSIGLAVILGGIAGIVFAKRQLKNNEVLRND